MARGVFSIDTYGEGWDLLPIDVKSVELGERVVEAMNPLDPDKIKRQHQEMVTKLVRFAQQVEKWVEWYDLGLSTDKELIEDVRIELANLSLATKRVVEDDA